LAAVARLVFARASAEESTEMLQKGGAAEHLNCFICAVRHGDAMTRSGISECLLWRRDFVGCRGSGTETLLIDQQAVDQSQLEPKFCSSDLN
jgi:hypothetical protein